MRQGVEASAPRGGARLDALDEEPHGEDQRRDEEQREADREPRLRTRSARMRFRGGQRAREGREGEGGRAGGRAGDGGRESRREGGGTNGERRHGGHGETEGGREGGTDGRRVRRWLGGRTVARTENLAASAPPCVRTHRDRGSPQAGHGATVLRRARITARRADGLHDDEGEDGADEGAEHGGTVEEVQRARRVVRGQEGRVVDGGVVVCVELVGAPGEEQARGEVERERVPWALHDPGGREQRQGGGACGGQAEEDHCSALRRLVARSVDVLAAGELREHLGRVLGKDEGAEQRRVQLKIAKHQDRADDGKHAIHHVDWELWIH